MDHVVALAAADKLIVIDEPVTQPGDNRPSSDDA